MMWIFLLILVMAFAWLVSYTTKSCFKTDKEGGLTPETEQLLETLDKIQVWEKLIYAGVAAVLFSGLLGLWLYKGFIFLWPEVSGGILSAVQILMGGLGLLLILPVFHAVQRDKKIETLVGLLLILGFLGLGAEWFIQSFLS